MVLDLQKCFVEVEKMKFLKEKDKTNFDNFSVVLSCILESL